VYYYGDAFDLGFILKNVLGASFRVGLLRISLRFRTSYGWFPLGSFESLAQFFLLNYVLGYVFKDFVVCINRAMTRNFYYVKHQTALVGCRGVAFF
jgi:hypothetical protein